MHTLILKCIYDTPTYQVSFHSVVCSMYTGTADSNVRRRQHDKIFFAYSHGPLLENADIYTSTLILCNSLNYNLIDIELGTILHLPFFYHSSELYGQNCWYQYCTALS